MTSGKKCYMQSEEHNDISRPQRLSDAADRLCGVNDHLPLIEEYIATPNITIPPASSRMLGTSPRKSRA